MSHYLYLMENPLVSVVLCSYNGMAHIEAQVESILSQTYRPLELVIADDASTDGTPHLLQKYKARPGVKLLFREKNIGLAANFTSAAATSAGSLIAFSDQDDIWLPGKIETLVREMGNWHLVYSDSLLVDENGKSLDKKLSDLKRMYSGTDSRGYVFYSCVWGHGMIITKELFQKSLPAPEGIHHDIWLAFLAFQNGGIKFHDEVLTLYRQHSSSSSTSIPQKLPARNREQLYKDFQKQLNWIGIMRDNENRPLKSFYETLYRLYDRKRTGSYQVRLFFFLLKNRKSLFLLSKKGFPSQLTEIWKQSRGVKAM